MSIFSDLVANVVDITNRPDRESLIKLGIRMATLKAHQTDFFPKDLTETGIQWPEPLAYIQSLECKALFPRWRAFKYLRKYDYTTAPGTPGIFFEFLQPESILDEYGVDKENVCYMAGAHLEIRSNTKDAYMLLGYYQTPDTNEATYDSWIAEEHPMAIIAGAAAYVFKQTGYDEQAAFQNQEVAEQYQLLKLEILGEGY